MSPNGLFATNRRFRSDSGVLAICLALLMLACVPARADHIHQLWYNNSIWQDQDLTALTGGPDSLSDWVMTAFYTTTNHQFHVFYVDASQYHVHQLYYNRTNWGDQDLTAMTGGPSGATGLTGFAIGNLQYVFYVGGGQSHVYELSYNNSGWSNQDLTALVGGDQASEASMAAMVTKPDNQLHVFYTDRKNSDLYEPLFDGKSWKNTDITASVRHLLCEYDFMAGFAVQNDPHILCGGYGHSYPRLYQIYYDNKCLFGDVTGKSGSQAFSGDNGLAGFNVPGANKIEAYGFTFNSHLHQYTRTVDPTKWTDEDLTNIAGAPTPTSLKGAMVSFVTAPNNNYHVFYDPPLRSTRFTTTGRIGQRRT